MVKTTRNPVIPHSQLSGPDGHHSVADWDYSHSTWELSIAEFVSPPTSLRAWSPTWYFFITLCNLPQAYRLPQGQITSWMKGTGTPSWSNFWFRDTCQLGKAWRLDCYRIEVLGTDTRWGLAEIVGGTIIRGWTSANTLYDGTLWQHFRATWWTCLNLMYVTLEREIGGVWVQQGEAICVPDPLFGNEPLQRCGVGNQLRLGVHYAYFDDTKIYAPMAPEHGHLFIPQTSSQDECRVYWDGAAWNFQQNQNETLVGYVLSNVHDAGIGLIFRNVQVPHGATIETAHITFTAFGSYANDFVKSFLSGELNANPLPFTDEADYWARTRCSSFPAFDDIAPWYDGLMYNTPEIKAIIQEIIDLPSWVQGSSICIFWDDHSGRSTPAYLTTRMAETYHHDPLKSAVLYLEW